MKTIYFDHNSTTPIAPQVQKRIAEVMEHYGNPSNQHHIGKRVRELVDNARGEVAGLLNVPPSSMVFTSGGTEANNLAIKGAVDYLRFVRKLAPRSIHIITSSIEHMSVIEPLRDAARLGCAVTFLPVDKYGCVKIKDFENAITSRTRLATIMFANNEIGTVQSVATLAKAARRHGVLFHTDAVQAAGKLDVDFGALGVDMFTMSGHKIGAPKGIGALHVKEDVHLLSQHSGGHQERRIRAGTENTLGIIALGEACRTLTRKNPEESIGKVRRLRDALRDGIQRIPDVRINGHPEKAIPNTVDATFRGIEASSLLMHLDLLGVCASGGSACREGSDEQSHVLRAIGLSAEEANATVRFSLGYSNTEQEVRYLLRHLPGIVDKLRTMSPSYRTAEKKRTGGTARRRKK